jgi:hypothetical protein
MSVLFGAFHLELMSKIDPKNPQNFCLEFILTYLKYQPYNVTFTYETTFVRQKDLFHATFKRSMKLLHFNEKNVLKKVRHISK